ncbi:FtsQ-type POTRA domain-containing protein [Crassaminicella thermophila]|uniref:FtsQ-type POTRA domain-containing protein n=1 Tax=Crassaminicella thermophila TaxID=2599308 RepID=A0A5C0SBG6_CRATE|nr:FtsQ-type POTRA domain-containing protein [Crassaminicella thermophila]QEK11955.1 FtsQ-type POTRA domain-containing protein [Crassaminicella thermophila]
MCRYNKDIDKNVKRKKNAMIFMVMLLLCIVSFIIIFKTDLFTVKYVEVGGNHIVTKDEIINISGIIFGNHIFKENINSIKSNLYRNPYIKTVQVKRKLPNKIIISVVEREEAAAIPFMNEFLIIDEDGMVLRSSRSNTSLDNENLKIIKGFEFSNFMEGAILEVKDKSKLKKALEVARKINENQIVITELDVSDKKDVVVKLTNELICRIGEGNNLNYSLKVLKKILEDLKQKNIIRGVIDMSHEGYPSYRPVE